MRFAQIEQGILKAYGGKFDLYALLISIGEEDQALLFFDIAVQAFELALHDTDIGDKIGDFIGSIMGIVGGIQKAKEGLPACEAVWKSGFDLSKLEQDATIDVENLKSIEENIIRNEKALRADMEAAIEAHNNEDYVEFGYHLGRILETATEKPELEEKEVLDKE